MQGFKGLIPKQLLSDEAFQPIFKKAEDQRKATQLCIDFFQLISKFFEAYSGSLVKLVGEYEGENTAMAFYLISSQLLDNIGKETVGLTQNTKGSFKELTSLCNTIFHDFSKIVLSFQTSMRKYQEFEQVVGQLSKKYYRTHKNMLASIDAYKSSFSDVNLIYNMDEKIKRYNTCERTFKTIQEEYDSINQRLEGLTQKKNDIIGYYNMLPDQYTKVTKVIGSKIISETKNFVGYFCVSHKLIITHLAEQKFALEKQRIPTFFGSIEDRSSLECFSQEGLKPNSFIPLFLEYHHLIKDEFLENYNKQLLAYLKEVENQAEKRRQVLKRLSEFFVSYIRLIEKNYIVGVKDILVYFQKMKKRLGEAFGNRLVSFLKSVNSFFQLSAGVNEKLVKSSVIKLQSMQTYINEENKLLKLFCDQLKNNIEKFIGKKELKKLKEDEFTQEENVVNYRLFRKEISQKAEFIKHLIEGFHEKMEKNCEKLKKIFGEIVGEINLTVNQFFSLCLEYQEVYFGAEQFQSNFKKYQDDIDKVLQKDKKFFCQLPFSSLKSDGAKITFDGEYAKVLDFKKIKKPYKSDDGSIQASPAPTANQDTKSVDSSDFKTQSEVQSKQKVEEKRNLNPPSRETLTKDQKQLKNIDFLMSKIKFKENQQLIKSYSCAYAEKIVLQGRIYITNERVCFSSNFNSANLFFGGTFIQVPKEDIKKIEKKKNALFIDNTLSFTTVNGQMAFTSFFSRNEAYDLICKTFGFNFEDDIYEFEEKEPELPDFQIQLQEDDDIKDDQLEERAKQIQPILPKFAYAEAASLEIQKEGFNALKIFKLFYGDSEIVVNKRNYPNFLAYVKNTINHKDLDVDPWDVELDKIVNKSNIKAEAPLKTCRKFRVTVPVSAAGVPFMPKTAKSEEAQTLIFFSKHRFIIYADITTTGAPYADTFIVQLKTEVTSDETGKCKFSIGYFVNFIKSTMMRSMIEGKTQEETVGASKVWMNEIKQYFVNMEKLKNAKSGASNPLQETKQELQQKSKEVEELTLQKEKLAEKIESLEKKLKIREYGLMAASVLILILALLAFS